MAATANANQDTAGADAGTTGTGASQNTRQATSGAEGVTRATRESRWDEDVGDTELLRAANARSFETNSKHLNERNSDYISDARRADTFLARVAEELFNERLSERASQRTIRETLLANLVDEQKRNMAQETRHVDLAVDRQWNMDEQVYGVTAAIKALVAAGVLETSILASLAKTAENLSARKTA